MGAVFIFSPCQWTMRGARQAGTLAFLPRMFPYRVFFTITYTSDLTVCVCVGVGVHTVLVRARAAPTCTTSFPKLIHLTKKFSSFILNLLLPLLKIPKLSALLSVDLSHTQSLLFVSSSPPPSTENSFFLLASNYCYYSAYYVLYLS